MIQLEAVSNNIILELQPIQGKKGDTGDQGSNGLSAYEVAVANGFVGTEAEWLASLEASVNPADYDLAEFTNTDTNPFVRESAIPETIIFNNPVSTTSTSPVLVRTIPIGSLANVKMIRIDAELERLVSSGVFLIELYDPVAMVSLQIKSLTINQNYARYFQNVFINNVDNTFVEDSFSAAYQVTFSGTAKRTFNPLANYDIRLFLTAGSEGTLINRGLTIQLYK